MWLARLIFTIIIITCSGAEELKQSSSRSDYKRSFAKDCDNTLSVTCLKLNIVGWVDKLNENDVLSVFPGVSILRENVSAISNTAEVVAELAREFPDDPNARLDAFVWKKVQGLLNTHSIKFNFGKESEDANGVTSRKKKDKSGGGMGMLLASAAMMKSTLFAIGMGALAALAGKALMTSLIALMLSGIIGLKSLTSGDSKTTYEVVSKPVYTHSSSHSSGHEDYHHGSGYSRSLNSMPLPLGLQSGYKPA